MIDLFLYIHTLEDFIKASLIKTLVPAVHPPPHPVPPLAQPIFRGGCPLCDRSVYSYCGYKMMHDACCCGNFEFNTLNSSFNEINNQFLLEKTTGNVPFNCPPDDCSYLNAKSCYEHALLFTCCCNNPYH